MCLILTFAFFLATLSFFSQGLIPHAIISGIIASVFLFFFIRKLITNGRCIFGKDRDCNKP
jgi:Na+/glutamate symporter